MFRVLFGEISSGRLLRLPYLGWSVLVGVLGLAIAIGIGLAIGVAEQIVGGDLQSAQTQLTQQFGIPAIILVFALYAVLLFASLNVMAKRLRDIGLPGWWAVVAIAIIGMLISAVASQEVASGVNFLVWIALLLVPTGLFGGRSTGAA